jgi:hypothetical protein
MLHSTVNFGKNVPMFISSIGGARFPPQSMFLSPPSSDLDNHLPKFYNIPRELRNKKPGNLYNSTVIYYWKMRRDGCIKEKGKW